MSLKERASAEKAHAPRFLLYGEAPTTEDRWIANVEPLADRCRDVGWSISPHSHSDFFQIVIVRSGGGEMTSDDTKLPFESPCVLCVPAKHIHAFDYERHTDGWVLTIAGHFAAQLVQRLPELSQVTTAPQIIRLDRQGDEIEKLAVALRGLDRELKQRAIGYLQGAEVHLWTLLLTLLRRAQAQGEPPTRRVAPKLVEGFQALVEARYRQNPALPDLASELCVSAAHLRAACVRTLGLSPIQILHERLMREAKRELLFGEMTVEQLSYWLGFASAGYFTRFFKRRAGVSPGEFRTAQRKTFRIEASRHA
jgi:AraC family transcriptional activator of pobA